MHVEVRPGFPRVPMHSESQLLLPFWNVLRRKIVIQAVLKGVNARPLSVC